MSGPKKIFQYIGIGVLLILLVPIVIILIPIAAIGGLIDIPFKKKRQEKLQRIVADKWIPNKKYIYICYNNKWNLTKFIETQMPKYDEHTIVDIWDEEKGEWIQEFTDEEERVGNIVQGILGDYDGDFDTLVAFVDQKTKAITLEDSLLYYQDKPGHVYAKKLNKTIKSAEAEKQISEAIEKCIRDWS